MVFTLHRYIFREAFKVFVLATVALTLILSLGSILRPVQEYGVGPRQVVHLMGYFLPITLTFVLPMAALFAAALVYGRLASDNELDACRASGISMLTLVYPGLALVIIVAIANLILSFHVVPAFVHRAEKSLKADAKQILFRNIKRRGYYELPPDGEYRVYADMADPQSNTLAGVVVTQVEDSQIKRIITAKNAKIDFNPHETFNEVRITAYNTYQMDPAGMWFFEWLPITAEFGSLLRDRIKFKNIDEMKKIRDVDLTRFYPIAKLARETSAQLTAELLAQDIAAKTAADPNSFYELYSGQKLVEFAAGDCSVQDEREVELSGDIVVIESNVDTKQVLRKMRATSASLHMEGDEPGLTLTMEIYNAMWQRADGSEGLAARQIIRGLVIPQAVESVTDEFRTKDSLRAAELASGSSLLREGPSSTLENLQNQLRERIRRTLAQIEAETHSRLVFGVGCVPLIMIGIGLGIIFKGGHLLSAFGASSMPAAVLIVGIMMGKNITKNPDALAGSGVVLMWVVLGFLSLLAVVIYRRLLKH